MTVRARLNAAGVKMTSRWEKPWSDNPTKEYKRKKAHYICTELSEQLAEFLIDIKRGMQN